MASLFKAKIRQSGKEVEVYKRHTGTWVDYSDCNTEYQKDEIIILNEINN